MAVTSTYAKMNQCVLSIDDGPAGTLTDVSGSTSKCDFEDKAASSIFRVFEGKLAVSGSSEATVAVESVFSTADDESADIIITWYYSNRDTARTVQMDMPNSSAGSRRFTGEFKIDNLKVSTDANSPDKPMMLNYNLIATGDVTPSVISA